LSSGCKQPYTKGYDQERSPFPAPTPYAPHGGGLIEEVEARSRNTTVQATKRKIVAIMPAAMAPRGNVGDLHAPGFSSASFPGCGDR
jgi:hypothetical protein